VKKGHKIGRQNFLCKECGRQFVEPLQPPSLERIDKKVGTVDWREVAQGFQERQRIAKKASWSQDTGTVRIKEPPSVIVLKGLSDTHVGNMGTDYESLSNMTDAILSIPYLFCFLLGDEEDNFVSFKNQMAVVKQLASPEEQDDFIESWLKEIAEKVLFATWGNHAEFEEKVSGRNSLKKLLNRNVTYFDGIGICKLLIGEQEYRIVATHKTRYNSSFNKTHGLKQLARRDIPDADLYVAGHTHDPAFEISFERGREQGFIVHGTLKRNDTFGKRYFSFFAAQRDAAITLDRDKHRFLLWPSLEDALEYAALKNAHAE